MKFLLLLFFPLLSFSQDKINIEYNYPENREDLVYNALNDIEIISLLCNDKKAKEKQFLLRVEKIVQGEVVQNDSLTSCENMVYPIVMNGDTSDYVINFCDRTKFLSSEEAQKIIFGRKYTGDSLMVVVNYPGMSMPEKMAGEEDFNFLPLQNQDEMGAFKIEIGTEYPVLALSPPFKVSGAFSSYCLIDGQKPMDFYDQYGVQLYYVYYLTVR